MTRVEISMPAVVPSGRSTVTVVPLTSTTSTSTNRCVTSPGRRIGSLLLLGISENGCDVLGISEQADNIDAIAAGEVEPAAREVRDAADTQAINPTHLAHPRRPGPGHPSDRVQRRNRCIEESFADVGAALVSVVVGSFDEIEFGLRAKDRERHA